MISPIIISGEASETDSDSDTPVKEHEKMQETVRGTIILGEDTESENDSTEDQNSQHFTTTEFNAQETNVNHVEKLLNESLLHKKLKERNSKLHTNMDLLSENVIKQVGRDMFEIDHSLLKSQIKLQSAITSLQGLNANSSSLKDKFHFILTSKFIANIKTK